VIIGATIENAVGVPGAFSEVPGITAAIEEAASQALKNAYASAFKTVFYTTIAFNVLALIAAFFIKDVSELLTNHTAIHLEKERIGGHVHHEEPAMARADVHNDESAMKGGI